MSDKNKATYTFIKGLVIQAALVIFVALRGTLSEAKMYLLIASLVIGNAAFYNSLKGF